MPNEDCQVEKFIWEDKTTDERINRAENRAHIDEKHFNMASTFTNKAFDFYGTYVRINEEQKYKYAETQITFFYRDLI